MPSRVIAFLLAIVLLWSGLGTIEATRAVAPPPSEHEQAISHAGGPAAEHEGSVEHHHLDDLPSQAQSDPSPETPGLLSAPLKPAVPSPAIVPPPALVPAGAGSPFLAGPLRPPRDAAVTT